MSWLSRAFTIGFSMRAFLLAVVIFVVLLVVLERGKRANPQDQVTKITSTPSLGRLEKRGLPPVESIILNDLQSVGLYLERGPGDLKRVLQQRDRYEELEEAWADAEEEDDNQSLRSELVIGAVGALYIDNDWKFDVADPLSQARDVLKQNGYHSLTWGPEERVDEPHPFREPERRDGIQRVVTLSYGEHELRWRFQVLPGLMEGVNLLLQEGGVADRFVELDTGGDHHVFLLASSDVVERMRDSELFPVLEYTDAWAGRGTEVE